MTSTISVALCTFNGERFIAEQVESILSQTRLPDEIVISDDGSADATLAIVEAAIYDFRRANRDTKIRLTVLRNPSALGVVRNFEQAISATRSDLVALSDQDDRWHPQRLELAAAEFETREQLVLLFGDARLVNEAGAPLRYSLFDAVGVTSRERDQIRAGAGLAPLLARNIVTGATTVFRRTLLAAALPFPSEWVHDEWLGAIASATGRLDYLDTQLIDYRQHGANVIGAQKLSLVARLRRLREPREARNELLVHRAMALVARLRELGASVPPLELQLAEAKLDHERIRNGLPARSLARVKPVLRELRSGGYRLYGRGLQDVLRDLVQPAR